MTAARVPGGGGRDDSHQAAEKRTSCAGFGMSSPSLSLPSLPTAVTLQLLITPHPNLASSRLLKTDGSKKPQAQQRIHGKARPFAVPLLDGVEGLPKTPQTRTTTAQTGFALPRRRCCPSDAAGVSEAPLLGWRHPASICARPQSLLWPWHCSLGFREKHTTISRCLRGR